MNYPRSATPSTAAPAGFVARSRETDMEPHAITDLQLQNILVPTDFSPCSQQALLYAVNIARHYGSTLILLHIIPPQPGFTPHPRRDETLRAAWDEMRRFQADLLSKGVLRGIDHHLLVVRGKDWSMIPRILKLQSADLIVMGTRGRTGWKKRIRGSFAESVFRRAACPVLTVGPQSPDQGVKELPRQILFFTDDSHVSRAAEPYAFQAGRDTGAQLTLLGLVHASLFVPSESGSDGRLQQAQERLEGTALYAAWREGGAAPNVVAKTGSNVKAILREADLTNADLIVLGISGEHDEPKTLGWADAYQVMRSARCPTLTVRHTFPDPYFKRLLQRRAVDE